MATQLRTTLQNSTQPLSLFSSVRAARAFVCVAVIVCGYSLPAQDLEADLVQAWEFQRSDLNPSDQWPKGWKRRQDREHPAYLVMKVVPRDPDVATAATKSQGTLSLLWDKYESGRIDTPQNPERVPKPISKLLDNVVDRCFEIQMDGASAEVIGPVVRLDPRYSYGLDASIQCVELSGHRAWIELEFLDESLQTISTANTEELSGDSEWRRVQCFSSQDLTDPIHAARVHLIVERNQNRNFRGIVRFDNVRINRVPRLELKSNLKLNIAQPGQECEITCTAIGISNRDEHPTVRFQLLDELGRVVQQQSVPLVATSESRNQPSSSAVDSGKLIGTKSAVSQHQGVSNAVTSNGEAKWKIHLENPGHFLARVYLGKHTSRLRDKSLPIAVVDAMPLEGQGPFGWSLPPGLDNEQLRNIPQLVRTFGASHIKVPVWLDVNEDIATIDQLAWLIERLQSHQVQCIGMIDQPPPSQRKQFNDGDERLPVVTIFQNKSVWEPLLDPILSRMTMKLNWFQLGSDDDHSFLANEQLIKSLAEIHASVQSYSQELHLAIAWPWLNGIPQGETLAWEATQFSIQPELRAEELPFYLAGKAHAGTTKWLTLNLLSAKNYALLDRVRDLTERITAMKKLGVTAAFVTKPMDADVGLFNSNFEPQAISVPWRTLNQHLSSALYVGQIAMPSRSINHVFQNDSMGVMILWNETENTERLYLGDQVDAVDLWGRAVPVIQHQLVSGAVEQSVEVGPWPIIVRGVNLEIARFRMQFNLGTASLQSLAGRGQSVPITLGNPFGKVIRGTMALTAPTLIEKGHSMIPIQISPDRQLEKEYPLELRSDVSAGKHEVRFDFQIDADRTEHFSTYHELTVGFDDIDFQWQLQKLSDTAVLLRLAATNKANAETTFQCKLFPPPYPYQHFQLDKLPPGNSSRELLLQLPKVEDGAEYWIRCEEVGTRRTLNYRVKLDSERVTRTAKPASTEPPATDNPP